MAAWAATAVRVKYPEGTLDWAVESRCADVVDQEALVTNRIEIPRDRWKKSRWSARTWRDQIAHYAGLRRRGYDLGFDLQGHSKTALCLYLAKPKKRLSAFATDLLAQRLNPVAGKPADGQHMVEWFGEVLNRLDEFKLPERPLMPSVAGDKDRNVATIALGAGQPDKTVSNERWSSVGIALRDQRWRVRFVGGPEQRFDAPEGTESLVGKTRLSELLEVVATSGLVLAGDTGAGHVAAAYGVPVVSVFGANDPRFFRPYTKDGAVLKRGDVCDFSAAEIVDAARSLMGERWPSIS
jgi:ADP-heptose:LPS heptosyltransferase